MHRSGHIPTCSSTHKKAHLDLNKDVSKYWYTYLHSEAPAHTGIHTFKWIHLCTHMHIHILNIYMPKIYISTYGSEHTCLLKQGLDLKVGLCP